MRISQILGSAMVGALVLAAATSASATSYTPTESHSLGLLNTNGVHNPLTFNQFDPLLGTLTDVHLTLSANAYALYSYSDLSGSDNHFQFTGSVTVNLENPLGGQLVVTIPALSDIARTVSANGTYTTPGWPATFTSGLTGSDSDSQTYFVPPALLALFTGVGTISLDTDASIAFNFNGDNDASTTVLSRYEPTVSVYYSYDAFGVPEPASIGFLSAGLLGMGAMRRRKQKKA